MFDQQAVIVRTEVTTVSCNTKMVQFRTPTYNFSFTGLPENQGSHTHKMGFLHRFSGDGIFEYVKKLLTSQKRDINQNINQKIGSNISRFNSSFRQRQSEDVFTTCLCFKRVFLKIDIALQDIRVFGLFRFTDNSSRMHTIRFGDHL